MTQIAPGGASAEQLLLRPDFGDIDLDGWKVLGLQNAVGEESKTLQPAILKSEHFHRPCLGAHQPDFFDADAFVIAQFFADFLTRLRG